jgi:hypothetical protein
MDFLKKHYEKIVLAVALVALIASAIFLALSVSALSSQIEEAPNPIPKVASAPHIPLEIYTNAIQSLAQPPLWTNVTRELLEPIPLGPVYVPSTNPVVAEFPVVLMSVVRKPFKLLFKIYSYDADAKEGYNFQINFQFRARTFFTSHVNDPIKDRYEDTGYRIIKFEKKSTQVPDPSLGINRDKDVSELTVQHEGGKPVVLVLGLESEDEEPVAQARCGAGGAIREYRRGQLFECERKTYKVVDIDLKQMIIVDQQSQEQHIIKSQQ